MPPVLRCFTDGAAKSNSKNACAGWAYFIPKFKLIESGSMRGTNNQAELEAIRRLLLHLHSIKDKLFSNICIFSDSKYSINAITGVNKAKLNKEIIEEIKELRSTLGKKVAFEYVEAHTNKDDYLSKCNAVVDKAASEAASNLKNEKELMKLKEEIAILKNKLDKLK